MNNSPERRLALYRPRAVVPASRAVLSLWRPERALPVVGAAALAWMGGRAVFRLARNAGRFLPPLARAQARPARMDDTSQVIASPVLVCYRVIYMTISRRR